MTDEEYMEVAASMGRSARFSQRQVAREIGLKELPPFRIIVNGAEMHSQPEDLSQWLPGETAAESFANSLAQVDAAERWGLDAMWLAELHFAPERSVLSSPMILATRLRS